MAVDLEATPVRELSIDEAIERLMHWRKTHPVRHLGVRWMSGGVPMASIFSAPTESDEALIERFWVHVDQAFKAYTTLTVFGVDRAAADVWLEGMKRRDAA